MRENWLMVAVNFAKLFVVNPAVAGFYKFVCRLPRIRLWIYEWDCKRAAKQAAILRDRRNI